ncbi:MAG: O-antigen ligase family protein [Sumerlaeia bacterium]
MNSPSGDSNSTSNLDEQSWRPNKLQRWMLWGDFFCFLLMVILFSGGLLTQGWVDYDLGRAAAYGICGLLGGWSCICLMAGRFSGPEKRLIRFTLYALLLLVFLTGIQLVPLPASVVRSVSPPWNWALSEMESTGISVPEFVPLAHSPARALVSWYQLIAGVCFYSAACLLASRKRTSRLLILLIICTSLLEGFAGFAVYLFQTNVLRLSGALVNPNHHAALILLAVPAFMGLFINWQQHQFGSPWAFLRGTNVGSLAVFVLGLMVVSWGLSLSRGSLLTGIVGLSIWVVLEYVHWRRKHPYDVYWTTQRAASTFAGIFAIVLLLLVPLLQSTQVVERFGERVQTSSLVDEGRIEMSRATLQALGESPLFGLGLAGANHAINRFEKTDSSKKAIWSHNDYVQLMSELGGIFSLVFLVALIVCGITARTYVLEAGKRFSWAEALPTRGCIVGFALVLFHAFVDFHLRIPLVGFAALALLALSVSPGLLYDQAYHKGRHS